KRPQHDRRLRERRSSSVVRKAGQARSIRGNQGNPRSGATIGEGLQSRHSLRDLRVWPGKKPGVLNPLRPGLTRFSSTCSLWFLGLDRGNGTLGSAARVYGDSLGVAGASRSGQLIQFALELPLSGERG